MPKYTHKPLGVEAIQLTETNHDEISEFVNGSVEAVEGYFVVHAPNSSMGLEVNNYVVLRDGEFVPMTQERFETKYVQVD